MQEFVVDGEWPERAFLQESGGGRLGLEENLVAEALATRSIPITYYTRKLIQRRQLPLSHRCFLSGDGDAVSGALRQVGVEPPPPIDYPEVLRPFLHRRIWRSTVAEVMDSVSCGRGHLFAKPAQRAKRFTGRVFVGPEDLYFLFGTSRREAVWCSSPVKWLSEWRAYVLRGQILALGHYSGDTSASPDPDAVRMMIDQFEEGGLRPSAYALDVGVLDDGRTALVEVNDAFALGAYGIDAEPYTAMLLARWQEMMRPSRG